MDNFRLAVKSLILNDKGELLIIKRSPNDVHKPGIWEIPGGRLEPSENPFEGLKRETMEETGLEIDIHNPVRIHHFTRDDGQNITMITFLCKLISGDVKLSEEHTEYEWKDLDDSLSKLIDCFHPDIEMLKKHFVRSN